MLHSCGGPWSCASELCRQTLSESILQVRRCPCQDRLGRLKKKKDELHQLTKDSLVVLSAVQMKNYLQASVESLTGHSIGSQHVEESNIGH